MTQVFTAVALAAVVTACWLAGRPRPRFQNRHDPGQIAALNQAQMALVRGARDRDRPSPKPTPSAGAVPRGPWPRQPRERRALLQGLERQFLQAGSARREALATCLAWGDAAALPLIRRGLRDSDTVVVALAAAAMARFRGQSRPPGPQAIAANRPRRVSRTR